MPIKKKGYRIPRFQLYTLIIGLLMVGGVFAGCALNGDTGKIATFTPTGKPQEGEVAQATGTVAEASEIPTFQAPQNTGVSANNNVALVGDSLSTGYRTSRESSWPNRVVQNLYSEDGITVTLRNATHNGAGYLVGGDGDMPFYEQTIEVVKPDTDLVILSGTENDAPADISALPAEVDRVVKYIKSKAPNAIIVFMGPATSYEDIGPEILDIRETLQSAAQKYGATFVDPIAEGWFWNDPSTLAWDGDHPSDTGEILIAQKMEAVLKPLLKQ